ncbi:MAG: response regulator receiver modulated metal dependent phosphohydrolase [Thermoleophilia bacterium]|nr:response regulator receiver modulated metal dependent phosphohydrolase [Thermoleophilia bacterium]
MDTAAAASEDVDEPAIRRVRVLVVDDDRDLREAVALHLDADPRLEVVAHAHDGAEAVRVAAECSPDIVLMDVNMPRLDGCAATEQIVGLNPDIRVIAVTGTVDPETITRMILAGAVGYAVKGSDPSRLVDIVVDAAQSGRFIDPAVVQDLFESVVLLAREEHRRRAEAERLAAELARAYKETVSALINALHSRDGETEAHGDRVADRVVAVGRRFGLDGQELTDLEYGALFHDIGKIAVPDAILHNTDALTEDEWAVIRQHTVVGEQIIRPIGFLRNVARIVRHSHEHWDGSGYPDHLVGEQIPLASRIVFACDAFDAMTSERTYQCAMTTEKAVDRMHELSGIHFDPHVIEVLDEVLAEEPSPTSAR